MKVLVFVLLFALCFTIVSCDNVREKASKLLNRSPAIQNFIDRMESTGSNIQLHELLNYGLRNNENSLEQDTPTIESVNHPKFNMVKSKVRDVANDRRSKVEAFKQSINKRN